MSGMDTTTPKPGNKEAIEQLMAAVQAPEIAGDGLKVKYHLVKADGKPVDPKGIYFVLKLNAEDPQHAKACRLAATTYALTVMQPLEKKEDGNKLYKLGLELLRLATKLDAEFEAKAAEAVATEIADTAKPEDENGN